MKALVLALPLLGALLLSACSDDAQTPQDQIRAYIDSGVKAAEDRSVDALAELMHDSYRDQRGYNKKQLGKLLRAYFFSHKNIHLFTRIDEIELISESQASVSLYVAMTGSLVSSIDELASIRARVYRFELQLLQDGDWLLQQARWEPANLLDLQ